MWATWKHTGSHCHGSISAEQVLCVHVAAGQVFGWKSRSFFSIRSESSSGTCIVYVKKEYLFLGDLSAPPARCFSSRPGSQSLLCPAASPRLCYYPSILLLQKSLRRAALGRPPALQEALFWVSMLMLCRKCILFRDCTNYKLVLGDEDKNISSWLVSVKNLWCYLETWYGFHVAGNVHAECEGLQQSWCRASLWSGWQIKQGRNFF